MAEIRREIPRIELINEQRLDAPISDLILEMLKDFDLSKPIQRHDDLDDNNIVFTQEVDNK